MAAQPFEPVRVAVAGAGYWGRNLVRNFSSIKQAKLLRVVDASPEVCRKLAGQYPGVDFAQDFAKALAPEIEAVVIASPAELHYELARRALEAEKHVFVEKPLTLKADDAKDLLEIGKARNKVVMVGHLLEYHPAVEKMKQLVTSGEIGEIRYIYTQRVNLGIIRANESALWSLAPHDLSVILTLIGESPTTVTAWGQAYLQKGIEDVSFVGLRFPGGKMAHVHCSWLDPHKIRKITMVGSKKMVVFDDADPQEKIRIYDKGVDVPPEVNTYVEALTLRQGDISIPAIKGGEPLTTECIHFAEAVRGLHPARSDAASGLRVVQILETADRSMKAGGIPMEIPPAESRKVAAHV